MSAILEGLLWHGVAHRGMLEADWVAPQPITISGWILSVHPPIPSVQTSTCSCTVLECLYQGVIKGRRLSLLTNCALVIRVQMRGQWGVEESQPMSTAVQITWHVAQINFKDLPPYLTYVLYNLWGLGTELEQGCRTGPPGCVAWRNWFLEIDSWAP